MNFPDYVGFVLDRLEKSGYSAYLVGGCVRDFLMGIKPNDFDITTNALPDEIQACFDDVKTLDIGKKHGTITLVFGTDCVEVTTYRIDGEYKDSRHPESVTFTDKIEDDLARRDFTINSIAYSPERGFADPFDGRGDIEKKLIVCVGEPDARFDEDALRILRGLRFSSRLGFCIDEKTACSMIKKRFLLLNIAAERINTELCGVLNGKNAGDILSDFQEIFRVIIPEIESFDVDAVSRAVMFDDMTKLAVFFSALGCKNFVSDVMKRMKFDSKSVKLVSEVLSVFDDIRTVSEINDACIKKTVAKIGIDAAKVLYRTLYCCKNDGLYLHALEMLDSFVANAECMSIKQLDVKGNEIIKGCGINPLFTSKVLSQLLEDVIDGKVENKKNALVERAKEYTL